MLELIAVIILEEKEGDDVRVTQLVGYTLTLRLPD